jgi:glycosyltransferase involved in cell wall biosynthesis
MRLAVVHYHLRKGGVTRVIASALEAMGSELDQAVVLSSTPPEEALPFPVEVIPELAYCQQPSREAAAGLAKALQEKASAALGAQPDLWHIHNHGLGKNVNFPEALRTVLADGTPALLQIHDFAEDGRPGNYRIQEAAFADGIFSNRDSALYPLAPQIGYAVLNGRDEGILREAGIPAAQVHLLPNPIRTPDRIPCRGDRHNTEPALILYPTRAIRRKNIGELLLWSIACPQYQFATTLSPKNAEWMAIHDAWEALASELGLNLILAAAERADQTFEDLVARATAMITTSVAEGFGLAFLEPFLWGKPVIGRDLQEITGDFKAEGISMEGLYPSWPVPLTMLDAKGLKGRYAEALRTTFTAYGHSLSDHAIAQGWRELTAEGQIDFGCLDERAQMEAIREGVRSGGLQCPVDMPPANGDLVEANSRQIQSAYGLSPYKERLSRIYAQLMAARSAPPGGLSPERVLARFLDLSRFRLLRT